MLKFTFNCPDSAAIAPMFHTATVRPTRSGPNILYNTSLKVLEPNRGAIKKYTGLLLGGRLIIRRPSCKTELEQENIGGTSC